MAQWMVAVGAERYQSERLYQADRLELPGGELAVGDDVVLVSGASGAQVVFGLARVVAAAPTEGGSGPGVLAEYVRRLIDHPVPVAEVGVVAGAADGPVALAPAAYRELVDRLGPAPDPVTPRRAWMVSLDLPIEATSAAEAVRVFWTYVRQLGPAELPAFVWPRGDELAMRPYVLGAEHEMDPEEEE